MIILKKMRWSNAFSYGEGNEIDFSLNPLTQILGLNGHGKSSIALILEEVLYNKNSKGIKKADIINRNINAKSYSIELEFNKDGDNYCIKTVRGSTQTVKLLKDGEDISSHTATATYKTIEDIIGLDHKAFSQLLYQSSAASLEFLTATDGNRKKFLIELLNLTKYTAAADIFKAAAKEVSDKVIAIQTKTKSVEDWLKKYSNESLEPIEFVEVPENPRHLVEEISSTKAAISSIDSTNKKIAQNAKYKELMDAINVKASTDKPNVDTTSLTTAKVEANKTMKDAEAFVLKMRKLGTQCPTCLQDIDKEKLESIISLKQDEYDAASVVLKESAALLEEFDKKMKVWLKEDKDRTSYEELHSLYDPSMQVQLLDKAELDASILKNEAAILKIQRAIKDATEANNKASSHNARIELITSQMAEMEAALILHREEFSVVSARLTNLQILVKTFSPTGLVAYKIECLIKDLEDITNEYLVEISSGRFQLGFKIAASDKLNVVVTDNGIDIDINALSGGERARVNTAALLGIRKLMQSLSNTRINLLILDETIENLDLEGKEKLVEVLLNEEYLNTFVISHGFSHPLLEKITVVKTNNISRIE
jgi:DNA repair exonuclease SbcCD ATPase subunit